MAKRTSPVDDARAEVTVAKNELLGISKRLEDVRLRLQRTENLYDRVIVNPMPEWKHRDIPDEDAVELMEDEAFAKMRSAVAAEKDAMQRLCAQSSLVKVVASVIAKKRDRIAKLTERVKSGDAGSEAEVAIAKKRIAHIEQMLTVLSDRFSAVVGDFAHTRKQVVSKLVNLTTILDEICPKGCTAYAIRFGCGQDDIDNSLRLLAEMNGRMKVAPQSRRTGTLAFGGRNK